MPRTAAQQLSFADLEALPTKPATTGGPDQAGTLSGADRAALNALEVALADARAGADDRPPLLVLASCLGHLGVAPSPPSTDHASLRQAREDWLRRLETSQKSGSALVAYRVAIDDLLDWSEVDRRSVLEEATIVDYLSYYQQRARPAPATYYRRFLLLRRFLRWVSRRDGLPDPFLDLEPPPKPRQERDWLTHDEFRRLVDAAGHPDRNLPGLAERDQLVLLVLVTTGLRRSELCALEWRDLELDGRKRSLLVRCGKGGKPRRQPLPAGLVRELRELRDARRPEATDPSSAVSPADVCRRRSSPTSSAAPRGAPGSRRTSPPTRFATPPRPGSARSSATLASSPNISGTPTFRPSRATRTSTVTSSSPLQDGWSTSPRRAAR